MKVNKSVVGKILRRHDKGISRKDIAKELDISITTVASVILNKYPELKQKRGITEEEKNAIRREIEAEERPKQRAIARKLNIGIEFVRKIMREEYPEKIRKNKISDEVKVDIIKLYKQGESIDKICEAVGEISNSTVWRIVQCYEKEQLKKLQEPPKVVKKVKKKPKKINLLMYTRGLKTPIMKLREQLKEHIGERYIIRGKRYDVVEVYEHFFVVQKRGYKECINYIDVLLGGREN